MPGLQAEARSVQLAIDTNQLENEFLLQEVRKRELEAMAKPASQFASQQMGTGGMKLDKARRCAAIADSKLQTGETPNPLGATDRGRLRA